MRFRGLLRTVLWRPENFFIVAIFIDINIMLKRTESVIWCVLGNINQINGKVKNMLLVKKQRIQQAIFSYKNVLCIFTLSH